MEAADVLKNHQKQIDADGAMVGVSRQALDEVLDKFTKYESLLSEFITEYCDREGDEDRPKPPSEQSCFVVCKAMTELDN